MTGSLKRPFEALLHGHRQFFDALHLIQDWLADSTGAVSGGTLSAALRTFWQTSGERHIGLEDEVLIPECLELTPPLTPMLMRMASEHRALRESMTHFLTLRPGTYAFFTALCDLETLLGGHLRFEQDVLLPRITQLLTPDQFAGLAERLNAPGVQPKDTQPKILAKARSSASESASVL